MRRRDRLLGSEDRPAERVILPELADEDLVDQVVRRVLHHADLFEDDAPLHLDVGLREARAEDDVGQQIERDVDLLVEHVRVEGGVLLPREGVHVPAENVDDAGDVGRRTALGPLEDQVLEEMRRPGVLGSLDGRTAAEVIPERDRSNVGESLDENGESGGEDLAPDADVISHGRPL